VRLTFDSKQSVIKNDTSGVIIPPYKVLKAYEGPSEASQERNSQCGASSDSQGAGIEGDYIGDDDRREGGLTTSIATFRHILDCLLNIHFIREKSLW
jgi:hypothetical protein